MLRSTYRASLWVSVLGLLLASPLAAQEHPAVERGFAADKVYQLSGLDQVGLLNGALTERIPIGGAYRLGAVLRYRLNLTYSSKFWSFEAVGGATRSLPNRLDNAGVGWLLSLGRLIPPGHPSNETLYWQYQSPDGAIHALYDVLHPGDTPESGVFYSKDSTIVRMKELPTGERTLEFSDRSIHTFRADGIITKIADVNGNHLDVEYPDGLTWKLTDQDVVETYTYGGKAGQVSQRNTAITVNGGSSETFTQGFTYTDLGNVASLDYPRCTFTGCTSDGDAGAARNVSFTYDRNHLIAIPGYSSSIDYYPNSLLHHVYHEGAARLVQNLDANGMARPSKILAKLGTATLWSTGSYSYDGAGNIVSMGDSSFVYDKVSRLTSAKVSLGQQGTGSLAEQGYTYDAFGNLTAISGNPGRSIPTDSSTNRLSGSVSYDGAGNLLAWNGNLYEYDPLHMMKRLTTPGGEDWLYVYTADDERILMYGLSGPTSRYTLRDLAGKVLREYTVDSDYWTRERDHIYGNGQLLVAETPEGRRHFYADHLGTPRLITDASGNQVSYHVYFPFGEEATNTLQDQERMKFTGHERDFADPAGVGDDLDYMHARFCSPITSRFLSPDPVGGHPWLE